MRKIIVLLAVLLALVGAAAADSISGAGSYTATQYLTQVGSGSQTMATGMDLTLSASVNGVATPVAESTVANSMTLALNQLPTATTPVAPIVATQSGGNTIALNNGQEPGSTDPQNWDFQSTSNSGGDIAFASEGVGNTVSAFTGTLPDAAAFSATSTGIEKTLGYGTGSLTTYITDPVTVTDKNTASGYATPDVVTLTTGDVGNSGTPAGTYETSHLKSGEFNWACTDSSNVKLEDDYVKDTLIGSGISSSSTATGEVNPLFDGMTSMFPSLFPSSNGVTATSGTGVGLSTGTSGQQTISIAIGTLPL